MQQVGGGGGGRRGAERGIGVKGRGGGGRDGTGRDGKGVSALGRSANFNFVRQTHAFPSSAEIVYSVIILVRPRSFFFFPQLSKSTKVMHGRYYD